MGEVYLKRILPERALPNPNQVVVLLKLNLVGCRLILTM